MFSPTAGRGWPAEDVLTAEQRERRMREVEAEVAQLVGWGSEEARHRGSKLHGAHWSKLQMFG